MIDERIAHVRALVMSLNLERVKRPALFHATGGLEALAAAKAELISLQNVKETQ